MGGNAPDAAQLGPLPACTWPRELYQVDAGGVACTPARRFISCVGLDTSGSIAIGAHGLSNGTTLEGHNTSGMQCEDRCHEDEYAIQCGGFVPDAATQEAPTECRLAVVDPDPDRTFYMCCPCGW
jgi:hypothetical protein